MVTGVGGDWSKMGCAGRGGVIGGVGGGVVVVPLAVTARVAGGVCGGVAIVGEAPKESWSSVCVSACVGVSRPS
jgi:hypothetical protein